MISSIPCVPLEAVPDSSEPCAPADLLPWADPYIVELFRGERQRQPRRAWRAAPAQPPRPIRNELSPPLGVRPLRAPGSLTRRDRPSQPHPKPAAPRPQSGK